MLEGFAGGWDGKCQLSWSADPLAHLSGGQVIPHGSQVCLEALLPGESGSATLIINISHPTGMTFKPFVAVQVMSYTCMSCRTNPENFCLHSLGPILVTRSHLIYIYNLYN